MKGIIRIFALAVAAVGITGLAACGGSVSYRIGTSPYWDSRVVIRNDLTEGSEWFTRKEVATYSISYTQGNNGTFTVDYFTDGSKPASYTAEFYADVYDWSSASLPEQYRAANTSEYVYVYKTEVVLSGEINFGNESKQFDNHITTVSYFRSAQDNLQPVYSKQVIKCTSPANLVPSSLEDAYVSMDCEYETFYNLSCTQATVICKDNLTPENSGESTADISTQYSLFDSNSLGAALRSLTASGTQVFDVFVAIEGKPLRYQAAFGSAATLDTSEYAQIASALDGAVDSGYLFVGKDADGNREYSFNQLTLSLVSSMPGSSSVYWYANVTDTRLNAARAVLLKIANPVPFALGTLDYSLTSLTAQDI